MQIMMNTAEDAWMMDDEEFLATAKPATMEEVAKLNDLADERSREWHFYVPTFRVIGDVMMFYLDGPFEG